MANPRNLANIAPAMNGSGGKVTIGGSTPLGTFNLVGLTRPSGVVTYTSAASVSNAQAGLNWYQDNNTNYEYYLDLFATATSESPWGGSNIRMLTTPVGSATAVERARITRTGNMLVGTTTNNASGGVLQISNGITFPATQSASSDANTLDDYEEGTFTPQIFAGGSQMSGGSLTALGSYTKIGRAVYYLIDIYISTKGTGSGSLQIRNLPFSLSSGTNAYAVPACLSEGLTSTISGFGPVIPPGYSYFDMYYNWNSTGGPTSMNFSQIQNASGFRLTGLYFTS